MLGAFGLFTLFTFPTKFDLGELEGFLVFEELIKLVGTKVFEFGWFGKFLLKGLTLLLFGFVLILLFSLVVRSTTPLVFCFFGGEVLSSVIESNLTTSKGDLAGLKFFGGFRLAGLFWFGLKPDF